ncbi:MAG: hypothetical protein ACXADW_21445 [Candidatus Hodarchaeales archaeon]
MEKRLNKYSREIDNWEEQMAKKSFYGGLFTLTFAFLLTIVLLNLIELIYFAREYTLINIFLLIGISFFTFILLILAYFPLKVKKIAGINKLFINFDEKSFKSYLTYTMILLLSFYLFLLILSGLHQVIGG